MITSRSHRSVLFGTAVLLTWVMVAGAQSSRPGVGSIPYADAAGTGVTFRVWAPNASSVGVKGEFSGWATLGLTTEGSSGYWSRDVAGARAGQQYKYVLNNSFDRRDPRGRRVTNSAGNSMVYDPYGFDWGGVGNVTPYLNDLVIYEMHAGTYNAEAWVPSTFDQVIERLDHLKNLGVSAVQVMPPFEFAGDKSWGYNPADPYAIESALGGPDAFKRFVKAAHQRGIAVLVDVVHNHYGPSDLALWQFDGWSQNGKGGIYFYNDSKSSTMWGETRPDYGRSEVRDFIRDNMLMLLQECRVDGFRWDSVFSMLYANGGSTHLPDAEGMLRDINWLMATGYPGHIRIAEDHGFDFNMNFQAQWDVGFHDHLKWQVTQGSDAARNMQWLSERLPGSHNRVIYSESHDTVGALNGKHRLPRDIDASNPGSIWARKRQLLAQSIVMTTPGIPMVFQGQEMNEDWDFAAETALRWGLTNTHQGVVRAYRDLIAARRNKLGGTQGLKGTGVNVFHKDDGNKVIAYVRWDAGGQADDVVVVANFAVTAWTNNNYLVEFPSAGTWYSWYSGDSTNYGADFGNIGAASVVAAGSPPKAAVNMGMYASYIFSKTAPPQPGQLALDPALPNGCVPVALTYTPGAGPLAAATQVVAAVGQNGFLNTQDVPLTNNGAGVWSGVYTIPVDTLTLDAAFHDGAAQNRVWDNNLGADWHVPVSNCADLPSEAALSPAIPQGCIPVQVTYREWSGPLKDASNVTLFIGRNEWHDVVELPMSEGSPGVWTATNVIPSDTWQLDFVFHNGEAGPGRVWDNHEGQDWLAYVADCVNPLLPSVTITNPPGDQVVSNEVALLDLRGLNGPGLSGLLWWTNLLTGAGGTVSPSTNWTVVDLALGEGVNVIRISGTNDALNPNVHSADTPTNAVYSSGPSWSDGQDGGQGWGGGWQLAGGSSAGHFLAQMALDTNLNVGALGWSLWANNGGLSSAVRPLAGKLNVGDVLRVKFENNFVDGGASVGIGLQNRFGQNLFEFLFIGGGSNYVFNDSVIGRDAGVPWTDQGLTLEFELTTPTTYRFVAGDVTNSGTLAITSESVIDRFRSWNYQAGPGLNFNTYLADLQIDGPTQLQSSVYQDEVTVTRSYGPFSDQDGDGYATWEEEFAGTDPVIATSHLPDIGALSAGQVSQVDISSTVPARWYDVFVRTNLAHGGWQRYGVPAQGSGGALALVVTNDIGETAFYRTGVFQP
jgi:1,4-alpha-glucan branching enzyme